MAYLYFPSQDVLSLVLSSQALPASVQLSACKAFRSTAGELFVEPAQRLDGTTLKSLDRFGVKIVKQPDSTQTQWTDPMSACCWQQLLPLQKCKLDDSADAKTILFTTRSTQRFTDLATEMIRLGNDRISFRHVEAETSGRWFEGRRQSEPTCILLRVIEPPYYSLVDVLDSGEQGEPNRHVFAYREQAPRVWVRVGFEHSMADRIDPPAGHFLLIDPPHGFQFVKEAPFHDIYQALELRMPEPAQAWQPVDAPAKLQVHLALTTAASNDSPELWVIRQNAMEQLEQLVNRSDNEIVDRLAFAVVPQSSKTESNVNCDPIVVLRVRPSRAAPPILILDAVAYGTYLRLPNLFVPLGMRLQPPLRRDAIAKLLASDNRMVSWLEAAEPARAGDRYWSFQTHCIPDAAFRPLSNWVDYVLDHHAQALDAWTESHRFEFEAFICKDDVKESPTPAPGNAPSTPTKPTSKPQTQKSAPTKTQETTVDEETLQAIPPTGQSQRAPANEYIEQLKQAEATFLKTTAPLDAPERARMWQHLGWLNSHLKHQLDTTICWSNFLWYEGCLNAETAHHWLQAELRSSALGRINFQTISGLISQRQARRSDVSLVAAYVARAVTNEQGRTELRSVSADLTRFFEEHENELPIRAVWLTALMMQQLVGGDTLGLARVRDRLLNRLYEHGLMGEFDIVSFLRGSGQRQSDQHRLLRGCWQELMAAIIGWLSVPISNRNKTQSYVKFMFAYCLVRLGEIVNGRQLLRDATEELTAKDAIHLWMSLAFNFRIEQTAQGGNSRDPLPEDLLRNLEHMDRLDRYKIDRMRQHSRVLEPHDRIDAYRRWHRRYTDELFQTLAELKDLLDLKKVEVKLRGLLKEFPSGVRGLRVLACALEYAPRLGDEFAQQLLDRVDSLLSNCTDAIEKSLLIHRSLYVAGHFGHTKRVNAMVALLSNELPAIVDDYLVLDSQFNPVDKERIETVEGLLRHSFRGLRKLGMREELSGLYRRIADLVESHQLRASQSQVERSSGNDASLSRRLSLLLCVASGYYFFGATEEAEQIADKVRSVLLDGRLNSVEQRRLSVAYLYCVSLGDSQSAIRRIFELFKLRSDGKRFLLKIEDTMTTSSHFSVSELELVEACLLSLLSDETSWDPQCQLWLDQDEFAIRKKIHADMRRSLHQHT